jgi:hypothetical protein
MANLFEQTYPHIAEWVQDHGWIEIGQDEHSPSFVRALDIGGWSGRAARTMRSKPPEWMEQHRTAILRAA